MRKARLVKGMLGRALSVGVVIVSSLVGAWSQDWSVDYPTHHRWWSDHAIINSNENNKAAASIGQLKNMAVKAALELNQNLPGGAGDLIQEMVRDWIENKDSVNNHAVLTTGQLKNVVAAFFDRLIEENYAADYPWAGASAMPLHDGVATVGQLKHVFSWDLQVDTDADGISDILEKNLYGSITTVGTAGTVYPAWNGDGTTNPAGPAGSVDGDFDGLPFSDDPDDDNPDIDGDGTLDGYDASIRVPEIAWNRVGFSDYQIVNSIEIDGDWGAPLAVNDSGTVLFAAETVPSPKPGRVWESFNLTSTTQAVSAPLQSKDYRVPDPPGTEDPGVNDVTFTVDGGSGSPRVVTLNNRGQIVGQAEYTGSAGSINRAIFWFDPSDPEASIIEPAVESFPVHYDTFAVDLQHSGVVDGHLDVSAIGIHSEVPDETGKLLGAGEASSGRMGAISDRVVPDALLGDHQGNLIGDDGAFKYTHRKRLDDVPSDPGINPRNVLSGQNIAGPLNSFTLVQNRYEVMAGSHLVVDWTINSPTLFVETHIASNYTPSVGWGGSGDKSPEEFPLGHKVTANGLILGSSTLWINGRNQSLEELLGGTQYGWSGWEALHISSYGVILAKAKNSSDDYYYFVLAPNWQGQAPASKSYAFSTDDAAGPRYRKVGLNGLPLSDETPQASAETDLAKEQTYVDAFNRRLVHHTSDVFVPLGASDLVLQCTRTWQGEVWNDTYGIPLSQRVNQPFGPGWTTNLCSYIEFVDEINPDGSQVKYVTVRVVDENGQSQTFGTQDRQHFFPLPGGLVEKKTFMNTLRYIGGGQYEYKKKFGTTLIYEAAPWDFQQTVGSKLHITRYARLIEAKDRGTSTLHCEYGEANAPLIPTKIYAGQGRDQEITITHTSTTSGMRVDTIQDPRGNLIDYAYKSNSVGELESVTFVNSPANETVGYLYDDDSRVASQPSNMTHTHFDLARITSPEGHYYSFTYEHDDTHTAYKSGPGTYLQKGLPRLVSDVQLFKLGIPTASFTSSFVYSGQSGYVTAPAGALPIPNVTSALKIDAPIPGDRRNAQQRLNAENPGRITMVKDADGNKRWYSFEDLEVLDFENLPGSFLPEDPNSDRLLLAYRALRIVSEVDIFQNYGTEIYRFTPHAGYALSSSQDMSGNTTQYEYNSSWGAPQEFSFILNKELFGSFDDPSVKINALGQTTRYEYENEHRLLERITDLRGTVTDYTFTDEGQRESETVTSADGVTLKYTTFDYDHTTFKAFMTGRTTEKITNAYYSDEGWVKKISEEFAPDPFDSKGYVWKHTRHGVHATLNPSSVYETHDVDINTFTKYDANGNKIEVEDPRGNKTLFAYDKRNRLTRTTLPQANGDQVKIFVDYDKNGNKKQETQTTGLSGAVTGNAVISRTMFTYDEFNRVSDSYADLDGDKIKDGRSGSVPVSGANIDIHTSFTYNNVGSVLTVTDPRGYQTTNTYDCLQRLLSTTVADGIVGEEATTEFSYSFTENCGGSVFNVSGFQPTRIDDPEGYFTFVEFDELYREVRRRNQYGNVVQVSDRSTDYDDVANTITTTGPESTHYSSVDRESLTRTKYDPLGRQISVINGLGSVYSVETTTEYTSTGLAWRTVEAFDSLDRTTTTHFNRDGSVKTVYSANPADGEYDNVDSPATHYFYDKSGNLLAVTDPRNFQTQYEYDARNRRTKETLPTVVDAENGSVNDEPVSITGYDDDQRTVTVTDPRGNVTVSHIDRAGRTTQVDYPSVAIYGETTNQVSQMETVYDLAGNVIKVTDGNGHVTDNTYDALSRLKSTTTYPTTNSGQNIVVQYEYDLKGNQTQVTDGEGNVTQFDYDGLNRRKKITYDPGESEEESATFVYDDAFLTTRYDGEGRETVYHYDYLNRLKTVSYDNEGADDLTYTYDDLGRITGVSVANGTLRDVLYTYDYLDRLTSEKSRDRTHSYTSYDKSGNRLVTEYAGSSGRKLVCEYDALNRLTKCTESTKTNGNQEITNYGYDLNGNIVERKLPNDITTIKNHNSRNWVTDITEEDGATDLAVYSYQYDHVGNVREIDEDYTGSGSIADRVVTLTYDRANRLTSEVVAGGQSTQFQYDRANNRTQETVNSASTVFSYGNGSNGFNGNQLYSIDYPSQPDVTYTYDGNGNRTSKTVNSATEDYAYDFENRLIEIDRPNTTNDDSYQYDYRTRRVEVVQNNNDSTSYSFSGGTYVQEFNTTSTTTPAAHFIRGSGYGGGVGGVLYSLRGSSYSFFHYNSRGDVTTKTDSTGDIDYQAAYFADGDHPVSSGANTDRQQGNTKDEDASGFINDRMRYRDIESGVYLTRDPAGFVDGPNLYTYVRQNPWTSFDPYGLETYDGYSAKIEKAQASHDDYYSNLRENIKSDGGRFATDEELQKGRQIGKHLRSLKSKRDELFKVAHFNEVFLDEYFIEMPGGVTRASLTIDPFTVDDESSYFQSARKTRNFGNRLITVAAIAEGGIALKGLTGRILRTFARKKMGVSSKGIDIIESHLTDLGPQAIGDAANQHMIQRLRAISQGKMTPTKFDNMFYAHELRERALLKQLGGRSDDVIEQQKRYMQAHDQALKEYGIDPLDSDSALYHPDAQKLF